MYERGTQALDQRRWDRAQALFDDVIKLKGRRVDGALYWKAYAQNKQGQRAEALATLCDLAKRTSTKPVAEGSCGLGGGSPPGQRAELSVLKGRAMRS